MGSVHAEVVVREVDRSELIELTESCGQLDFIERSQRV